MDVLRTFKEFHPWTRRLLVGSLILGILLTAGFAATDAGYDLVLWGWDPKPEWLTEFNAEWFHSHAYIPNIYAAATGFLIGVPVALVVLATFTIQRENRSTLDRVNRLSQVAWYSFLKAVSDFATEERLEAVEKDAPKVQTIHEWAHMIISEYIAYIREPRDQYTESVETREAMRKIAPQFRDGSNGILQKVKDSGTVELQWAKVLGAWNTLNQYVRLQRLEQGLEWFDPESDARLAMWMSRSKNPLQEFTDIHGFKPDADRSPITMQDAAEQTYVYAGITDLEFRGLLDLGLIRFGNTSRVHGYADAHKEAANFLVSLHGAVSMVEAANWPESASKPLIADGNQFPRTRLRRLGSTQSPEEFARELEMEDQTTSPET